MAILVAVFAAGAGLGSFVRSVVFRYSVPAGTSLRRACPDCGGAVPAPAAVAVRPLSAWGRCRWCGVRVGSAPGVPGVSTGLGLVGAVAVAAPPWTAIAWCWLVPFAVALASVDAAVHRLPDRLVLIAGVGLVVILAGVAAAQARPGAFVRAVAVPDPTRPWVVRVRGSFEETRFEEGTFPVGQGRHHPIRGWLSTTAVTRAPRV